MAKKWRHQSDPLLRGDGADEVGLPAPDGDTSIVRHVLYMEGPGRETPYLSTSELREAAEHFAGRGGRVWSAMLRVLRREGLGHVSRRDLLDLLRGTGKGRAKWHSAFEVAQARRYAEQWHEHLVDFAPLDPIDEAQLREVVDRCFSKA